MLFYARITQPKPYKSHFRTMEITFTAKGIGQAYEMIGDMIEKLNLGDAQVNELYRDEGRKAS